MGASDQSLSIQAVHQNHLRSFVEIQMSRPDFTVIIESQGVGYGLGLVF